VINRVDGLERWIEATGRAYFENGVPVRLVGMVQDVTDRTLSGARLQQSEARLRELDRRKDEFLSMLAHELRNPVAPIRNAAEALCILQLPDQRQRSLVEIIKRQVAQLTRLLDDLLDVARITQGRIELRLERVSISSCLEIAVEMTQPLIREKGHRLSVTQSVAPLYVHADRVRIAQCITNMLLNAAKYTEESGEIRVHVSSDAEAAVVEITDTGIGIASEFLPRAFDLFAQGDRTIDRSQGGLGVGLSVCKQLIEMHGGTVSALSAGLGKGSTFVIRIPLVS
jgi:signal transduction histidine kinase